MHLSGTAWRVPLRIINDLDVFMHYLQKIVKINEHVNSFCLKNTWAGLFEISRLVLTQI